MARINEKLPSNVVPFKTTKNKENKFYKALLWVNLLLVIGLYILIFFKI